MHPYIHAQNIPDQPAYIMASTDEVVTYKQLNDRSNQIAQLARARGLQIGDGIAIFMDNNVHFWKFVGPRNAPVCISPPFHRA